MIKRPNQTELQKIKRYCTTKKDKTASQADL
jgi:hypothetical protein